MSFQVETLSVDFRKDVATLVLRDKSPDGDQSTQVPTLVLLTMPFDTKGNPYDESVSGDLLYKAKRVLQEAWIDLGGEPAQIHSRKIISDREEVG